MARRFERRSKQAQRAAIERLLAEAEGTTRIVAGRDGSVFVYDERRSGEAPGTRRTRVRATGETDIPEFLALS